MKKIIIIVIVVVILSILGFIGYKYFNVKNTQVLTDLSLVNIKKRGKLIVGSSPPYGVMEFYDGSGTMAGVDIDVAKEIALAIGVNLEMKDVNFNDLDETVATGGVDIGVASLSLTEERSKKLLVSSPYFEGGVVFVVRSDDNSIQSYSSLNGKKIGIEFQDGGKVTQNEVVKIVETPLVKTYEQLEGDKPYPERIIEELINNNIDAFAIDYIAAISLIRDNSELKILGTPFTQDYYVITTKLGNESLMNEINSALREMKRSNKLNQIKNKWLK